MHFRFDVQKASEAAAKFLELEGGSLKILKLVKLLYILDRESIKRRGVPVVGGRYFSMQHGPVTSEVLDLINGGFVSDNAQVIWDLVISDRQNHEVNLKESPGRDHLSDFELELIQNISREHRGKNQWKLRDWCHEFCDEWTELQSGCQPIELQTLAEAVGRDAVEIEAELSEVEFLDKILGK
jgi:uncharacterized phage-associated protein